MKTFNFFEKLWEHSRTLRRVGLVLVMCLTFGIGNVWATDRQHYVGVALSNPNNYTVKLNVNRSGWGWYTYGTSKAGLTYEGKKVYIANYQTNNDDNYIYDFQWQLYDGDTQKYSKNILNNTKSENYYDYYIYNYDGDAWYTAQVMNDSRTYFDATGWTGTDIRLVISHAQLQKYHTMYTVTGTKLYYTNDLSFWDNAMGVGVVSGGSSSRKGDQTAYWEWMTDISSKATEYTGLKNYSLNNNDDNKCYLIVNNGKEGETPDIYYESSNYLTYLNNTQTYNTVVKVGAGSYSSANSKATISISSYELTSQGVTTNRTPSISTSASSTTVSACRTATTRLQVGTVDGDYQFDGWYTAATGGSLVSNSTDYTYYPTSANTYYARFSQKAYTLTYYANGGTGSAPAAETIYSGNTITVKDNINRMTKSGKVFAGWAKGTAHRDAGTVDYIPGVSDTFTADGNVDLYAIWKDGSYFISITDPTTNGEKNTTDFVSTQNLTNTARTVNGVTFSKSYYNTSGSISSSNKIKGYNETSKYIIYDAKTTVSKVRVYMKHNSGSTTTANIYYYVAKEGVDPGDNQTFALTNGSEKVLEVDLSSTKGARFVIGTDQYQRADFTQIIAIEEGTAFPSVGETGYQVSFPGRTATIKEVDYSFNGLTINSADALKIDGGSELRLISGGSRYVSFETTAATQLQVTTGATTQGFTVCTNKSSAAATGYSSGGTASTTYSINLMSAGTYYIVGNTGSNEKITKIAFANFVAYTAPTGLAASDITSTTATLTVTDGSARNYEFYVSETSTAPTAASVATHSVDGSKTYNLTSLTAATKYYVWVRAVETRFNKSSWVALTGSYFTTSSVPTHDVTAVTSTGTNTYGTVSSADASVAEGGTTTITAVPATGYRVTNWAVSGTGASISPSGSSNSTTTTLTMGTADAEVTVTFGPKPYTVTLNNQSATTAGTESVSTTYAANTNLTSAISCPAKTGKVFAGYFTETNGGGVQLIDLAGNWIASAGGGSTYLDASKNWKYDGNLILYACWMEYASTLDFKTEAAKGTPTAISTFLESGNMVISSTENVSWDKEGTGYEGLKIKKSGRKLLLLVESGKKMSITLGKNNNAKISKNGRAEADLTKEVTTNFGPMDADSLFVIRTTSDGAVSVQKILIEDPCSAPTIGSGPSNVSICPGSTTMLSVGSITGGETPYTYQWYTSADAEIDGATSASFTTPTLNAAASYYCIVTEAGGCTTKSSTAAVSMKTTTAIGTQPAASTNANVGSSCSITGLAATGTNLSYQWYTCDSDGKNASAITSGSNPSGYATATLSFTPSSAGTTYYKCIVSGDCGTETSNVSAIIAKTAISPTLTYDSYSVLVGSTLMATLDKDGSDGSVTYSSSNDAIATVASDGTVTGVAAGTVTITATIAATSSYWGNTAVSSTITVSEPDPIITYTMDITSTHDWGTSDIDPEDDADITNLSANNTHAAQLDKKTADGSKTAGCTAAQSGYARDNDIYVEFCFKVASGKKLVPSKVSLQVSNIGSSSDNNMTYDAVLSDGTRSISGSVTPTTDGTLTELKFTNADDSKYMMGNVTLRVYPYNNNGGTTGSGFRMGQYVKIWGEIETACSTITTTASAGTASVTGKTTANLPYTLSNTTGVASVTIKVYDSEENLVETYENVTSSPYAATGLNAGTTYTYTVTPIGESGYCDGSESSASSAFTTQYGVTYDAGVTLTSGSVPTDANGYTSGANATVLGNTGNMVYGSETFLGWTDGTTFYVADNKFIITANTTLTAVWSGSCSASGSSSTTDVTASGYTTYQEVGGSNVVFTSTPSLGFKYKDLDGNTINNSTDATIRNNAYSCQINSSSSNRGAIKTNSSYSNVDSISFYFATDTKAYGEVAVWYSTDNFSKDSTNLMAKTALASGKSNNEFYRKVLALPAVKKENDLTFKFRLTVNGTTSKIVYIDSLKVYTSSGSSTCFDVTFADGSVAPTSHTTWPDNLEGVPTGKKIVQPEDPTASGYTFGGWYADAACTTTTFNFSGTITKDTTIYAKWTANDYSVRFNANYPMGTVFHNGGSMSNMDFTYGTAQNLTANAFACEGYNFGGWATTPSGEKEYNNEQEVSNLTGEADAVVDLYAVWNDDHKYYFARPIRCLEGCDRGWTNVNNWTKRKLPSIEDTVYLYDLAEVEATTAAVANIWIMRPSTPRSEKTYNYKPVGVADGSYYPAGYATDSSYYADGYLDIEYNGAVLVTDSIRNVIVGTGKHSATTTGTLRISASGLYETFFKGDTVGLGGVLVTKKEHIGNIANVEYSTRARKKTYWDSETGTYQQEYINQYFGIPFLQTSVYTYYGMYLYAYSAETNSFSNIYSGDMTPFNSYMLISTYEGISGTTFEMNGELMLPGTSGKKTLNLIRRSVDVEADKSTTNMFANSWTAPLHIGAFTGADFTGCEATFYLFNAGSKQDSIKAAEAGKTDQAGQWTTLAVSAVKADPELQQVIPPMQAFLVVATGDVGSEGDHKIDLDYKKHVYDPALDSIVAGKNIPIVPVRAPKQDVEISEEPEIMRFYVEGATGRADHMFMYLRDDFTEDFDNCWDGRKITGGAYTPQLFAVTNAGWMALNATNDAEGTVVGFRAGTEDNSYTFTFEYEGAGIWYLNDLETQTSTMIENEGSYSFMATAGETYSHRFIISVMPIQNVPTGIGNVTDGVKARKLMIDGLLYIIRNGRIYDATGKSVK